MSKEQEEQVRVVTKIKTAITQLKEQQDNLASRLTHVKVQVTKNLHPDVFEAIRVTFGLEESAEETEITFEMYTECLRLMRAAGSATAEIEVRKGI